MTLRIENWIICVIFARLEVTLMDRTAPECSKIPRHVAVIMDGNGRWAESRGLERAYGHIQGVETVRTVLKAAVKHGIEYLTVYAFSTENWGRPRQEVEKLMELLCSSMENETPQLFEEGVRLRFIGNIAALPGNVREMISRSENSTAGNTKITLVVAVNYSSRWEITDMARRIAGKVLEGGMELSEVDAAAVEANMVTAGIPDPDLLIRTGGELRLSNFMLWQLSYSELYFTDIYWPDFTERDFDIAIDEYSKRGRRYGTLNK